jgi:hypothetical protein
LSVLLIVDLDSSFEGDCECVEGGLPAVAPALAATAGGVEAADGEVQAFHRGLLVGEVAADTDGAAEAACMLSIAFVE